MRYFSGKILRLRFAPLRMTHYFSWVQTLQILIYPAGLIFLDEYRQVSYNDNSRIDFSAATEP